MHDMEISCLGRIPGEGDCSFKCRISVASHEEGLRQATELHKQQRKEQEKAVQANPSSWFDFDAPSITICEEPELDAYPSPCWDCFMFPDM